MLLKRERPQFSVSLAPAKTMSSKLSDVGPLQQLRARFAGQPCEPNPAPQPPSFSPLTDNSTAAPILSRWQNFPKNPCHPKKFSGLSLILGMGLTLLGIAFNSPSAMSDTIPYTNNSTLRFSIKSDLSMMIHLLNIHVKFYSQDRNVSWPGRGKVYPIRDYELHSYNLSCQAGEKICYGAWTHPFDNSKASEYIYWGVGRNNESCKNCCYICNGDSTGTIKLNW